MPVNVGFSRGGEEMEYPKDCSRPVLRGPALVGREFPSVMKKVQTGGREGPEVIQGECEAFLTTMNCVLDRVPSTNPGMKRPLPASVCRVLEKGLAQEGLKKMAPATAPPGSDMEVLGQIRPVLYGLLVVHLNQACDHGCGHGSMPSRDASSTPEGRLYVYMEKLIRKWEKNAEGNALSTESVKEMVTSGRIRHRFSRNGDVSESAYILSEANMPRASLCMANIFVWRAAVFGGGVL
eukprot:Nk52_evm11s241 gene=Nk52_evmTU11s241